MSGGRLTWDLEVVYSDRTERVSADQRDVAAFEVQPFGASVALALRHRTHTLFRYLAWHALQRQGRTQHKWLAWSDIALQVDPVIDDDEDEEEDQAADEADASADPGTPAADAESSSGSPS